MRVTDFPLEVNYIIEYADRKSMDCSNCGERYDPNKTGWKCPHCGHKDHCCDGA